VVTAGQTVGGFTRHAEQFGLRHKVSLACSEPGRIQAAPTTDESRPSPSCPLYFVVILVLAVGFWIISVIASLIVAPDDRPWSFWCPLLFPGPVGIAVRQCRTLMPPILQPYGHTGFVLG
jgi:hypothetical protein